MISSLTFVVMLLIMIIIPTILYSFFFLINCPPPNPFAFLRRNRSANIETINNNPRTTMSNKVVDEEEEDEGSKSKNKYNMELVVASSTSLGQQSETECPVCLSVYVEGEELRQLNKCKHLFHKSCIDKWISTHSNCPVCRAFVRNHSKPNKERESNNRVLGLRNNSNNVDDRHDLWQGLPDSAGLV